MPCALAGGTIGIAAIDAMMEPTDGNGLIEVEIMPATDWWTCDPDTVPRTVKDRLATCVRLC
ncbi:hypothetical protein [Limobrevibacterium gyesilva]|nr:hypothetical protein [Limobrevibacterium gyesilva]